MTIDGFLTFLGFLVAAYAVLNPITRLRMGLHSARQVCLSILFLPTVLLLLFFDQIKGILPSSLSEKVEWLDEDINPETIGPNKLAFLLVLSWTAFSVALYKATRPNSFAIRKLRVLVERLHDEKRFLELIEICEPYVEIIDLALKKELPLQKQHYRWRAQGVERELRALMRSLGNDLPPTGSTECKSAKACVADSWQRICPTVKNLLSHALPSRTWATNEARTIENLLLKSPSVSDTLAFVRPDISLKLSSMETRAAEEFRSNLFSRMLSDSGSRFYSEVKLLEVTSGEGNYVNLREAPFLGEIVTNSDLASRLNISKAIGDEAIRLISTSSIYKDRLNEPCPDETEIWNDPVFCVLRVFSMMVSAAIRQGQKDNMWLMYMSHIAMLIEKNHKPNHPNVDSTLEFPTLGCRLLFEITCNHQDWLRLSTRVSEDNFHVSSSEFKGNVSASIPWSAAFDYAETIRFIVGSSRLPVRFRKERWQSYVNMMSKLPQEGALGHIRQRLISEAVNPTSYSMVGSVVLEIEALHEVIDQVVRYSCPDLEETLKLACSDSMS